MAIIKCKMCGGDLALVEGSTIATCEFCGSRQTVPSADSEKKLTLFARANRLRAACEFDKAAGIYESIVADFPEESEAYWGLVLCKYGIEYVDDPASGKKIPTCHRSSYDSVMDDVNLEQALENADITAQQVYRDEAKQFERIRKGILEVSSNEQPYDIFICYKETAPNGDRTLDSVLAQDLYGALTDKGYRVFFSRITLQGKLGEAYEPYIFAALNSAKVMLAVGTSFEYYNAVWVKNEWSRYLKICEADKSKHLIPCFKDLDPEDMPKEFRALQGADLGKMGAVQDILFNMEKYIPLKKQTIVQEKVVVGGSGDNKIASLLDRGNMALEDGDWAKADSFFEDVLNNDSKNAQAYIGKTLALEKCRTMDAFVRKRKAVYQNANSRDLAILENNAHIEEMAQNYYIPGYFEKESIRKLYRFDRSYRSTVEARNEQFRQETAYWDNHKLLSRAKQFATGAVAENLEREKQALFTHLSMNIKNAEKAAQEAKHAAEQRYAAHIAQADEQVTQLHEDGLQRREKDYQRYLSVAKSETTLDNLRAAQKFFDARGDFKDSKALAEHCRKRISDITAEQARRAAEEKAAAEAEAERQRILAAQLKAQKQAKTKKIAIIAAVLAVVAAAAFFVVTQVIIPGNSYKAAVALMEAKQYEEAIAAFEAMDGYSDSEDMIIEANNRMAYDAAEALLASGNPSKAIAAFEALGGYRDAANRIQQIRADAYASAEQLLQKGDQARAAMLFGTAGDYQDASTQSAALWSKVVSPTTVAIDTLGTVALKTNGTAVGTGKDKYGQFDLSSWENIISVARSYSSTLGLRADGTVAVAGLQEDDISQWTDIVAISGNTHTLGLKNDGTVVASYGNTKIVDQTHTWSDIIAISTYDNIFAGLTADGKVMLAFGDYGSFDLPDDGSWSDIVAIDAGNSHLVALRADGTVVAAGSNNNEGQCNVSSWNNIVAVSAGNQHTVGVRRDGTVVAVGHNDYGQCDVSGWTDIVTVVAGPYYTVGLKADGTLVAAGSDKDNRCNFGSWTDIMIGGKQAESLAAQKKEAYAEGESLLAQQRYDEALAIFQSLGNYEDAPERVKEAQYGQGEALLANGSYKDAVAVFAQLGTYKESARKLVDAQSGIIRTAQAGDVITFGRYEQDGNTANGPEEIQWVVLENAGGNVKLMSKYILTKMAFDTGKSNNWNNSSVKKWLNGTFLSAAFTNDEQAKLQNTSAGTVYLVSKDELEKCYGNLSIYTARTKIYTQTTNAAGRYGSPEGWWWWTRTSDGYHNAANCVKYVSDTGSLGGNDASYTGGGIRPAITITVD